MELREWILFSPSGTIILRRWCGQNVRTRRRRLGGGSQEFWKVSFREQFLGFGRKGGGHASREAAVGADLSMDVAANSDGTLDGLHIGLLNQNFASFVREPFHVGLRKDLQSKG